MVGLYIIVYLFRVEVDLDYVLSLNKEEGYVHVEPSVCIGFLNKFLVSEVKEPVPYSKYISVEHGPGSMQNTDL